MQEIAVLYEDAHGRLNGTAQSDGTSLLLNIGGCLLEGRSFDALSPQDTQQPGLSRFTFGSDVLCDCTLTAFIPIEAYDQNTARPLLLEARFTIGPPIHYDFDFPDFTLVLQCEIDGLVYTSPSQSDSFEIELNALQSALPNTRLRICFFCALAGYAAAHDSFGTLGCFRSVADQHVAASTPEAFDEIWDLKTEYVQETHCCNQFMMRPLDQPIKKTA